MLGLRFRCTVGSITDYFPINPNKSLNGTSHHPIMPLQKLRDVSIKCSLCPQIKIYIYIIMYVYTFIVTSAKLNLFVGNYLKSCLRKCFKEKISAKKICTPFFTVSHKMKTKLGGASKDSFMFTPNPWGNDPI